MRRVKALQSQERQGFPEIMKTKERGRDLTQKETRSDTKRWSAMTEKVIRILQKVERSDTDCPGAMQKLSTGESGLE